MRETRYSHAAREALAAALPMLLLLAAAGPALAQSSAPRGALSINGGLQTAAGEFSDTVNFGHELFGPEDATVETRYPGSDGALFDVGGSVRVWRNLGVGASVSWLTRETDADVEGQLPHPFRFESPRGVSGAAAGLARAEAAVHVQASWVIPVGPSLAVTLFGGPTWFNASQDLVTDIRFDQAYPYDTATYSGANTAELSASAIGAHAGADVAYYFSERIGVGGMVRFSGGSVEFDYPDGGTFKNNVGGLHTVGGLRIRF